MTYSDLYLQSSRRIPTVVSLVVVLAIIVFLAKIFSTKPPQSSAKSGSLRQMMVVNLSVNQAGIFWQSQQKSVDWVVYGEKPDDLSRVVLDDRDVPDAKTPYLNHLITLKDLKENSTYFFKIVSNNSLVSDLQNKPFSFKTTSTVSSSSNLKPAYGKVIAKNGIDLVNAAVVFTNAGTYPLVAMTKSSGDWLIPLNNIIDIESGKPKLVSPNDKIKIEIYDEENAKINIDAVVSNLSPLPQSVIMGSDYSFLGQTNVLSATSDNVSRQTSLEKSANILFPKEGALIPGLRPLIKGTATPGSEVIVIVNSEKTYSYRTKADSDGVWRVELTENLPAGNHTITVSTKDASGQTTTVVRNFSIAKSGEQVLGSATPEATPIAIASPTIAINPSSTSSAQTTPPVSGQSPLPYILSSASLIILGLGLLLAF